MANDRIDRRAGLDEDDDLAWRLQLCNELLGAERALDFCACEGDREGGDQVLAPPEITEYTLTFRLVLQEVLYLVCRPVERNDVEALIVHVQDQVLAL